MLSRLGSKNETKEGHSQCGAHFRISSGTCWFIVVHCMWQSEFITARWAAEKTFESYSTAVKNCWLGGLATVVRSSSILYNVHYNSAMLDLKFKTFQSTNS